MPEFDLDLPYFVKETQLQHGLRGEDYTRYHAYLSNRVATLRKQVHLSNDKKKFLHKEITPLNAVDLRHVILLVFYAERCWASAEAMQATRQLLLGETRAGEKNVPGGVPPPGQYRKRLNKAVHWAEKLVKVAEAVASERLQQQCQAYLHEVRGRCSASHEDFRSAKTFFLSARKVYFQLLHQCDSEASGSILRQKLTELDDRVVYCMQRLEEDVASYVAEKDTADGAAKIGTTVLEWNGRQLNVFSMKVKDALREARAVPVEEMQKKVLEAHGDGPVPVGQLNRVLEAMDRRIGCYNDALAHARQDLRTSEDRLQKTELQLLVHYFLFHAAEETLHRKLFMADIYARRFHATEKVLRLSSTGAGRARKGDIPPAQYASSLEVVRLYETGLDTLEEMELLPGVAGRQDTEAYLAMCRAGKVLFIGEGWRVLGRTLEAEECYRTAMALLANAAVQHPRAKQLQDLAQRFRLQVASLNVLACSSSFSDAALEYLSDAVQGTADEGVVASVAKHVIAFPPSYQVAPAKPTFVDIASTFIDFDEGETSPDRGVTTPAHLSAAAAKSSHVTPAKAKETPTQESSKWGFKWGWGSK